MSDPVLDRYKSALKQLGLCVKTAHKSKEGKQLPAIYWLEIVQMLKKAKLGISMMELGIDDDSDISSTHDRTKDSQSDSNVQTNKSSEENSEETSSEKSTDSKLAAIGLKKESDNLYDILNHLSILLLEKFENVYGDGTEFTVNTDDRKFTIKFDDKFYMVSEEYNFELGDSSDLNQIVEKFYMLTKIPHSNLVEDYEHTIV